ncbi:MAG: right-handed parallel beta-helix repeat-containing protein [Bacteroidota bacterium]
MQAQKAISLDSFLKKYESDVSLALFHALETCKSDNIDTLIIPKRTYDFYPEKAYQQYVNISNNENGLKYIALPIINQKNLFIDGQGAVFKLNGLMMGSIIHQSENVTIANITFDWEVPFYVQGKVMSVDSANRQFDLRFADYVKYKVANNDVLFEVFGKEYMISSNFWFDPDTGYPVYNLVRRMLKNWNAHKDFHYSIEDLVNNTIRVSNVTEVLPEVGWDFIAKWRHPDYRINRAAPSIHIFNSKVIELSGVTIHSAAGMGVIGERSEDILLNEVKVIPTPNTDRVISVTADATHFVNCRGQITLRNCLFESQLDDGLNIHGNYAEFIKKIDDQTIAGKVVHRQQVGFQFAQIGDTIQFIDKETLLPIAERFLVKDIRYMNDSYFEITTDRSLDELPDSAGLENISWVANLEMKECSIGKNWARSVLFKTPGKIVISNNKFYSSMSGARNWGEMIWFYESGNVTDVLISDNEFIDLCRAGTGMPVIVIHPQIANKSLAEKQGFYNRNIRIVNNTIRTFDRAILKAYSVNGLQFSDNTIVRTNTHNSLFPNLPVIKIDHCNNLIFTNNKYTGLPEADIEIDKFSHKNGRLENNKGFMLKPAFP